MAALQARVTPAGLDCGINPAYERPRRALRILYVQPRERADKKVSAGRAGKCVTYVQISSVYIDCDRWFVSRVRVSSLTSGGVRQEPVQRHCLLGGGRSLQFGRTSARTPLSSRRSKARGKAFPSCAPLWSRSKTVRPASSQQTASPVDRGSPRGLIGAARNREGFSRLCGGAQALP
jgi:hypothetical protein